MGAWVVCALIVVVVLKPSEFVPALMGTPLLYVLFGIAVIFTIRDLIWKRVGWAIAPHVPLAIAFLGWALLTTTLKRPDALDVQAMPLLIVLVMFLIVAVALGSSRGMRLFAITFLGCAVTVAVVAIVQGEAPLGCMVAAPDDWSGRGELEYDGRACETSLDCSKDAPDPTTNYRCEHVGPWKTTSIGGRVRYRGSLADPNELTLMTGMAIPFAFALIGRRRDRSPTRLSRTERRSWLPHLLTDHLLSNAIASVRSIPLGGVLALMGVVTVLSRSRGGLLVYLVVVGLQLIRRLGAWGIVGGCLLGPPMLVLGGRGGSEAAESSAERTDLIREAFQLIRHTRGIGLGVGQFSDESSVGLTAHNAYLLAAAEAGVVGLLLFGLMLYAAIKVPVALWFGDYRVDPWLERVAPALAISLAGALIGIVFLSWAYKDVLYLTLGASAALHAAANKQDPRFRVALEATEVAMISTALFALIFAFYAAARVLG
jgi:O-antigen ligase